MSYRARKRHRSSGSGSVGKKVLFAFAGLLAVIGIALGGVAFWVQDIRASAPEIDALKPIKSGGNSEVYAADGSSLGYVQTDVNREVVPMREIPKRLQLASIAIEDEHFYEHDGVDYGAVGRAFIENLEAGEIKQGGSTITQQLVRNLYIDDPEDTIERKIVEAQMAMEYEDEYSKKQILNRYLNTASYGTVDGRTAVGVEAASQVFFNKHVSDLDIKESALLAGLPQAPTDYNPFLNPKGATERRNQVLRAMANQGYISQGKYRAMRREGLGLERGYRYETREQQYFFDYVQQELIDRYGVRTVRDGGLKVYTTLEPRLQVAAEQAIAAHPVTGAASALVSTKVDTGEIIAMASSGSYDDSEFNLAAQGERQPGSSFKPYVLMTAVDQGIDPDSTYYSAPSSITLYPPNAEAWSVTGGAGGTLSLREATANSVNTVYAQLGVDVGPENFTEMAKRMGITSELEPLAPYALGGTAYCCTVLEMSNAYGTIADGGVHHDPTAIDRVVFPDGKVEEPADPEGERIVTDGVAYTVADVMTGTLDYGTAACCDIPCPAAGKTGTTEEQSDAWFVGYTPHVSTAVWTGNPDARVPLPGYGADLSAPVWHDFMLAAASEPCDDFPVAQDPASLSGYSSSQTVTPGYEDDTTYTDPTATTPTTPEVPTTEDPAATDDAGGYDSDLYAPGAGQEPAPATDDTGGLTP